MMPFQANIEPIPRKIHFIWLGGPIPEHYLRSIAGLAKLAKKDGYEINLWVDNEKNYAKTADQCNISIPNLNIRNIRSELYEKQNNDPFYQNDSSDFALQLITAKRFQISVERELIGFHNFAAASDLLRLEILRQEGGWYFDTDTEFPDINPPYPPSLNRNVDLRDVDSNLEWALDSYKSQYQSYLQKLRDFNGGQDIPTAPERPVNNKEWYNRYTQKSEQLEATVEALHLSLLNDYRNFNAHTATATKATRPHLSDISIPKLGIVTNHDIYKKKYDADDHIVTIDAKFYGSNDILGAVPNNDCIKCMIIESMHAYQRADMKKYKKELSQMDLKRFPNAVESRRLLTMEVSGPGVIQKVMSKKWDDVQKEISADSTLNDLEKSRLISKTFHSTKLGVNVNYDDHIDRAAGITVISNSDLTWLSSKKTYPSFDTSNLPDLKTNTAKSIDSDDLENPENQISGPKQ